MDLTKMMAELKAVVGKPDGNKPVPYYLATSLPNINVAVSGDPEKGFGGGRIVSISGPESCGKTALMTELMVQAQKAGGLASLNDHEHAFEHRHAVSLGLNIDKGWYYKKPDIAEEGFAIIYKLLETVRGLELGVPVDAKEGEEAALKRRIALRAKLHSTDLSKLIPIVCGIDSIASMIPASQDIDWAKQNMKTKNLDLAFMLSLELKRIARDAENSGAAIICLNQLRENPGVMFGDKSTEPGGNAMKFYASMQLRLRRVDKVYMSWGDKKSEVCGDIVELYTRKNKLHRPFQKTRYIFRTHGGPVGLDLASTMTYLGKEAGILGPVAGVTVQFDGAKHNINEFIAKGHADPKLAKKLSDFVMANSSAVTDGPVQSDDDEVDPSAPIPVVLPPANAFSAA